MATGAPGSATPGAAAPSASQFDAKHPEYAAQREDWQVIDDCRAGERVVKSKGDTYLPITSGQRALGVRNSQQEGFQLYEAYKKRALFPSVLKQTVNALVGIMNRKPWNIQVPKALEPMLRQATSRGEPLDTVIRRVQQSQLFYGRRGLMLDVDTKRNLPYIVDHVPTRIINWDDVPRESEVGRVLTLVMIDETRFERKGGSFTWDTVKRFRALTLGPGGKTYTQTLEIDGQRQADVVPSILGKTLDFIPFVFVNATDLVPSPGEIPTIDLARLALAIYRGEADYRQALFNSGQDTLVITGSVIGGDDEETEEASGGKGGNKPDVIIGQGAYINIPEAEGDAKYIGTDGKGLSEQRSALENDYERAEQFGVGMLNAGKGAEAAETLRIRVAGRTATLSSIVDASAEGIRETLRNAAVWIGADPEEVVVEPNKDFVDDRMTPSEVLDLVRSKMAGAPLSWRTVHGIFRARELTEKTFDEEIEEIETEDPKFDATRNLLGEEDDDGNGRPGEGDNSDGRGGGGGGNATE